MVYEQADSLQGVGKALSVKVNETPFIGRAQVQQLAQNNPKFADAVFSADSTSAKRNTDAIEVAPNTLIAGRVLEYKPAAARPFDEVKDEIRRQLVRRQAIELAQAAGQQKLALLAQGKSDKEVGLTFSAPVELARNKPAPGMAPDALVRIFQVDAKKLPGYVGNANERAAIRSTV